MEACPGNGMSEGKGPGGRRAARFFLYWAPPLAWMALLFYLSSQSNLPSFQTYDFFVKKGAHLTVYGVLYFLLFRAFHSLDPVRGPSLPGTYVYPALLSVLFAVSDEIHQSFVPFRTASFRDVIIDCSGMFLMYLAIRKGTPFFSRFLRKPRPCPSLLFPSPCARPLCVGHFGFFFAMISPRHKTEKPGKGERWAHEEGGRRFLRFRGHRALYRGLRRKGSSYDQGGPYRGADGRYARGGRIL